MADGSQAVILSAQDQEHGDTFYEGHFVQSGVYYHVTIHADEPEEGLEQQLKDILDAVEYKGFSPYPPSVRLTADSSPRQGGSQVPTPPGAVRSDICTVNRHSGAAAERDASSVGLPQRRTVKDALPYFVPP